MLAARVGTAVVGIPFLLGAVWFGGPAFWLLITVVSALAVDEARRLLLPQSTNLLSATVVICCVALMLGATVGPSSVVLVLGIAVTVLLAQSLLADTNGAGVTDWANGLAAVVYIGVPLAMLIVLRDSQGPSISLATPFGVVSAPYGAGWVLVALTTTWAVDTIAYVVGRAIGRRPFSPRLSPNKTWEGTTAGVVAGALTLAAWAPPFGWHLVPALLAGLVISVACIAGDLAESGLKRAAQVKDAGSLLPGHGGLLDRIDGLAFSSVVVFLLKALHESLHVLRWL